MVTQNAWMIFQGTLFAKRVRGRPRKKMKGCCQEDIRRAGIRLAEDRIPGFRCLCRPRAAVPKKKFYFCVVDPCFSITIRFDQSTFQFPIFRYFSLFLTVYFQLSLFGFPYDLLICEYECVYIVLLSFQYYAYGPF